MKIIIPKYAKERIKRYNLTEDLVKEALRNPDETVEAFLKSKGGQLTDFVRYEVGEGMEKREENFADEVKGQMK